MQTHSSLYLITALALGLGFTTSLALQSSPAVGYPLGAVSLGSNPIDMAAGTASTSPTTLFTASAGHDFVVTDVVLSLVASGTWYSCVTQVKLLNGAGTRLGSFQMQSDRADTYSADPGSPTSVISHAFSTGLVLSPGDSMTITRTGGCGALDYTIAGYHAVR